MLMAWGPCQRRCPYHNNHPSKESSVAKPNFDFQKRQKELAKKKKNEEKRQRNLEKKERKPSEGTDQPIEGEGPKQ